MPRLMIQLPEGGRRLDALLAKLFKDEGLTRSQIRRLMDAGLVSVGGSPAKASTEARQGQVVILDMPEPRPSGIVAMDLPLTILYEDEACIAVDKPSGLVTHPAKGHWDDTLAVMSIQADVPGRILSKVMSTNWPLDASAETAAAPPVT